MKIKTRTISSAYKNAERLTLSCIAGESCKMVQLPWKAT